MIYIERIRLLCRFWRWCDGLFMTPYVCDLCEEVYISAFMIIEDSLLCLELHQTIDEIHPLVMMFVNFRHQTSVACLVHSRVWHARHLSIQAFIRNQLCSPPSKLHRSERCLCASWIEQLSWWCLQTWRYLVDMIPNIPNKTRCTKPSSRVISAPVRAYPDSSESGLKDQKCSCLVQNLGRWIYVVVVHLAGNCQRWIRIGIRTITTSKINADNTRNSRQWTNNTVGWFQSDDAKFVQFNSTLYPIDQASNWLNPLTVVIKVRAIGMWTITRQ